MKKIFLLLFLSLYYISVSNAQTSNDIRRFTKDILGQLSRSGYNSASLYIAPMSSELMKVEVDIDLPIHNEDLKKCLCKELYGKKFTSIDDVSSFSEFVARNYYSHPQIGEYSTSYLCITSRCLSFARDSYYSYAYRIEIDKNAKSCLSFVKNTIYDVKGRKFLNVKDLLSPKGIKEVGIKKIKEVDISMDSCYLYVGMNNKGSENWAKKISLTENNRELFTTKMLELIGKLSQNPIETNPEVESKEFENRLGIHPWSSWDYSLY